MYKNNFNKKNPLQQLYSHVLQDIFNINPNKITSIRGNQKQTKYVCVCMYNIIMFPYTPQHSCS